MEPSTAGSVDRKAPTRFAYHEAAGLLWGEDPGDTVAEGRFVGVRTADSLAVSFVHAPAAGGPAVAGTAHVSVCVEAARP